MTDQLSLEDQIVAAIRKIIRAVDLHSRRLVEDYGLTGPQLATLQEAGRIGPVSAGALARAVHLSQPTVTGIVARLEKRGLVTRTPGATDRRTVTIAITEAGRGTLASAPSLLQDRFQRELERLAEWERTMVLSVLQRVAGMMDAGGLEAAPHLASGPDITGAVTGHAADPAAAPAEQPHDPPSPPASPREPRADHGRERRGRARGPSRAPPGA